MFNKILFATTASPDCDDAAKYAFAVAMNFKAQLFVFHVFGMPSHGYSQFVINLKTGEKEDYSKEYDTLVTDEIRKMYAEYLGKHKTTEIECKIGYPGTEILRKIKKEKIDLVIMGAHKQIKDADALRYRNVIGGTMQKVAKAAQCPVLIISRPYEKELWNVKHILCGTDFTKASLPVFRFALKFAQTNQCKLHLFHAVDLSSQQLGKSPSQVEIEEKVTAAKIKMKELYEPEMGGYKKFEMVIWEGIPHVEILKYARENAIDLIAMAHHSGSIFQPKEVFGSTVEEVVLRSACPVVCIKRMEALEDYQAYLT
jgi:nucleotide-binding universal stress UspA family protein